MEKQQPANPPPLRFSGANEFTAGLVSIWAALAMSAAFPTSAAAAPQGAVRMLYTAPNSAFMEKPTGDSVVMINDASGSVATLQASINTARSANPNSILVIRLQSGTTYWVTNAGLVLGSRECLVATGAAIKAASSSVTVPLIQISSGSTNVSVAGGTLDGSMANINGIYAPASARVNVDKVIVRNCGLDCILLKGNGNSTYDNEMSVTRCDVSGSPVHAGISIQNSTQTAAVDNNCHNNGQGIYLSCAWATVANNTCHHNTTGIDIAGGNDNVVANNTCSTNGVGIHAGGSNNMITSNVAGGNSTAGMASDGSGNTLVDNLFTPGNASNFTSAGSGNRVVAYKTPLSAASQDYFYPPLIHDQHTNTIVNGMGRTDLTIVSTTIDSVQSQYNSARSANPNNVIVLHLNGTFTVGAAALALSDNSCVLLNGTIQISSSTGASAAVTGASSPTHISISGGIIDGGNLTGNNAIQVSSGSMLQVDSMTLRNFGPANPRSGGSDVVHFDHGSTPYIVTRCTITGGSSRGIWLQLSGVKSVMSDNEVSNVNQDGVDCDSSTSGCVAKFNYCHDLTRYGVFFEQSASHNLALGNICNNDGRDINVYNNSATPRGDTAFNSIVCNSLMGNNGLRNGSTGTNVVQSSHNFFFNNTVINASIASELYGTQNYYSQTFQSGGSLSTAGSEAFFNSSDVTNQFLQDANSGLAVLVQNASTSAGAAIVIDTTTGLGNDQWQLVPTDSGYFKIINLHSGLALVVQSASTNAGAKIIQWTFGSAKNDQWMPVSAGNGYYNFINRLSGLYLDVTGANTVAGTQLDQQPFSGGANQQFNLLSFLVIGSFSLSAIPAAQSVLAGSNTTFTVSVSTNSGFSGSVNLGLNGLPSGASGGFSPVSLNGSGIATLNITTTTIAPPGNYTLTLSGTNGATVAGASVTLKISSLTGSPGTLVWTNGAANLNWSALLNWTNVTSGGFGPPGTSNDVLFASISTAPNSNTVDNIINGDTAISSLTFNNTNGYHTTQILPGATLTIVGAKGMVVGTETDLGTNTVVSDSVTGTGATLSISNAAASLVVRQFTGGASGGIQRAILDLSDLDSFTMTGARIGVGFQTTNQTSRSAGTLYLARSSELNLLAPSTAATTSSAIDVGDNPSGNSSQFSFLYLGQANTIYADGITVGGGRNIGWFGFNPAFNNSAAFIRGTNGDASRVTRWVVGDNSGANSTGSNSRGTNDFTTGTIDALVNTMILGRGESPSMGSGNSTGVVMFAQGTIDVNNLQLGVQASGTSGGTGTGTPGTNYVGQIDVNGSAALIVRSNLLLTSAAVGTVGGMTLAAILNINGGTVSLTNVVGGSGSSTVNLNVGTLDLQGGQITNVSAVNIGVASASGVAQLINAARISSPNVINLAPNGTLAGNTLITAPGLIVNGTISPGVSGIGVITDNGPATLGPAGSLAVSVQNAIGTPSTGWSFFQVNGALNIQATNGNAFTIQVQSFDPNGSGVVTNFNANTNYDWVTITAAGGIASFAANKFIVDASLFQNDLAGGYFYVRTNGNSLVLSFAGYPSLPAFTNIVLVSSNLVFTGASGIFGGGYYVLVSTNMALPLSQWPRLATNSFAPNGTFSFTNTPVPNAGTTFYRLQLQ